MILNSERKVYDLEKARFKEIFEKRIEQMASENAARLAQKDQFIKDLEKRANETLTAEQVRLLKLYNPTFLDADSQALMTRTVDETRLSSPSARVPRPYLDYGILASSNVDILNRRLAELRSLVALLEGTPYQNSVPAVIRQLLARSLELVDLSISYYDPFFQVIKKRDTTVAERDATIAEQKATIASRDNTISEQEATIAEREAKIVEQLESLNRFQTQLAGLNTELDALKTQFESINTQLATAKTSAEMNTRALTRLVLSFEATTVKTKQEAVVVEAGLPAAITIYVRPGIVFAPNQRVYVVRNGSDLLGEFDVTGEGLLRTIRPVATTSTAKAPVINVNDWVVRKELYVKSTMYPKAPVNP